MCLGGHTREAHNVAITLAGPDMYVLDVCVHILIASILPLPTFYHYRNS